MELSALKHRTLQYLQDHTDLDPTAAEALVGAVCDAAQADLLNAISGGEPYPSSMSDLRALRLRYMCEAAQRLFTTQEVAIVFRITNSAAQTLLTRMEVLYPSAVDRYLDALVINSASKAENAGEAGDYRYRIRFTQRGAWEHAIAMLQRVGCSDTRPTASTLTIEPPRKSGTGKAQRDTCDILGVPKPK
jgi:hypothetical protein